MITTDQSFIAFASGTGHVFYALIVAAGVTIAVLTGAIDPRWLSIALLAIGGVFADLWAHAYTH